LEQQKKSVKLKNTLYPENQSSKTKPGSQHPNHVCYIAGASTAGMDLQLLRLTEMPSNHSISDYCTDEGRKKQLTVNKRKVNLSHTFISSERHSNSIGSLSVKKIFHDYFF